jgi:hypothetical protein
MELFGYVCSPLCKAKAESHGIKVPVYSGQKSIREARTWRKVTWIASLTGTAAAVILGFWFWYAWFGSVPTIVFAVRFPEASYSGKSAFAGPVKDQLVFLHGDTLARYDMKSKREMWSVTLLDRQHYNQLADAQLKVMQQRNVRLADQGVEDLPRLPRLDRLTDQLQRSAAEGLELYVRGENVWVASSGKLVRYDWNSGKPAREFGITGNGDGLIARGDELMMVNTGLPVPKVTSVNLTTCDTQTADIDQSANKATARPTNAPPDAIPANSPSLAGLPVGTPGRDRDKAMDPSKVAEQAQHLSLPQRIALPVTLANSMNQERQLAAMDDRGVKTPPPRSTAPQSSSTLIPTKDGFVQLSIRVLESKVVQRIAAKTSAKPALDGGLTAGSTEAANNLLNEMQHERGGDVVEDDLSRYEVTLRRIGGDGTWSGEVTGPPRLLALQTVNVLAAGTTVVVLDKAMKKLWQSSLSFPLPAISETSAEDHSRFGAGPCVERDGSLYIFDQGFLACFDISNGNRRWGLPSVGITGLFFDEQNMMYVNTSSAGPEKIRYSRQIDLSKKTTAVVMKVDSRTGKVSWNADQLGLVNYVSGKLVLTVDSYQPPEEDEDSPSTDTGFETLPYLRIRRLNSSNGHEVWEHFQQRAPVDIGFEHNTIRLVFKKEVQVLRFLVF